MNTVEPIRDIDIVMDIADCLKGKDSAYADRNYMLWLTGIYSGLRISDILKLKVRDVRNKETIYIRDQKTGKENMIPLPDDLKKEFERYVRDKEDWNYLFSSRKYIKKWINGKEIKLEKPISRQQADNIIKEASKAFGIDRTGTHTMRKTFGFFLYQKTKDIYLVKEVLNHGDIAETRRYIGLDFDTKKEALKNISYRRK